MGIDSTVSGFPRAPFVPLVEELLGAVGRTSTSPGVTASSLITESSGADWGECPKATTYRRRFP